VVRSRRETESEQGVVLECRMKSEECRMGDHEELARKGERQAGPSILHSSLSILHFQGVCRSRPETR
jgi:hypothetical protein